MTVFSTRKIWLLSLILLCSHAFAYDSKYRGEVEARLGYHVLQPVDLSTHRYSLFFEQQFSTGPWAFTASAKGYAEGAFGANSRYWGQVLEKESQEVELRDLYLQWRGHGWTIRGGNQQVVWGEAFGFTYADMINPKDLRELSLRDLESQRQMSPLLNVKYVAGPVSLQGILIPWARINKMSSQGSDFSFPFNRFLPGSSLQVSDVRSLSPSIDTVEWGLRGTTDVGDTSLSVLYFHYFDRNPPYSSAVTSLSPLTFAISPEFYRLNSIGFTTSTPFDDWVFRTEALFHKSKHFQTAALSGLSSALSDEVVGVFGMDYSGMKDWRFSIQSSVNYRTSDIIGALAEKTKYNLSFKVSGNLFKSQQLDLLTSYLLHDGSSLLQISYMIPISSRLEFTTGADLLFGGNNSEYGIFKNASRAFIKLKAFLSDKS